MSRPSLPCGFVRSSVFNCALTRAVRICRQRHMASQKSARRALIGTGDRSERIRTYNYQENRITDHRVGHTIHGIAAMMAGAKLSDFISRLREEDQKEMLMHVLQQY